MRLPLAAHGWLQQPREGRDAASNSLAHAPDTPAPLSSWWCSRRRWWRAAHAAGPVPECSLGLPCLKVRRSIEAAAKIRKQLYSGAKKAGACAVSARRSCRRHEPAKLLLSLRRGAERRRFDRENSGPRG